ncbi:MAG: hypothetical protein E6K54_08285 [Gammaproteobacteria bacterium]|nr:MAG: hypothetical protein E6K54_08285 [Gammaproteobacteria bacterium]
MRSIRLVILAVVFSFFAVYTVIWAILEPIPINHKDELIRLYIILAISFTFAIISLLKRGLITHVFFRYVWPFFIRKLQSLSTRLTDDSLSEGWYKWDWSTGQPVRTSQLHPDIVEDVLFNKVCRFHDAQTYDAAHGIKINAKEKGNKINFFLKPVSEDTRERPVIYLRIILREVSGNNNNNVYKWLALVIDPRAGTSELSEIEETVYIKSNSNFMDWLFFAVNVREIVNSIKRWQNKYEFNNIDAIKVRGTFELASVVITE